MNNGNKDLRRFFQSDPRALTLLTLPAVVLFIAFVVVPIISGINISFTNWNGYSQNYSYVGFDNYRKMVTDPQMWTAFRNTLIYGFGSTLIQTILGLSLAMLLCSKFFFRSAARTIVYLPAMVAQLIIGYIWYFIVTYERGALNDIVVFLGGAKIDWMSNGIRAVIIIMLINSIAYCGKTMIIFIAGLQAIPDEWLAGFPSYNNAYASSCIHNKPCAEYHRRIEDVWSCSCYDQRRTGLCFAFSFVFDKQPLFR